MVTIDAVVHFLVVALTGVRYDLMQMHRGDLGLGAAIFAGLVFLSVSAFAATAAETYECKIAEVRNGIIRDEFRFVIDEDQGTATVFDPLISALIKAPIKARMSTKHDGQYVLRWQVPNVPVTSWYSVDAYRYPSKSDKAKVWFRALLNTESKQLAVRAIIPGSSNIANRAGTCKIKR